MMNEYGEEETEITAEQLLSLGYYQTSRRFRHLARLPEGKTGKEALLESDFQHYDKEHWIACMDEYSAGDFYLRGRAADKIVVSKEVFDQFRKLGGNTYMAKDLDRRIREMKEEKAGKLALEIGIDMCGHNCQAFQSIANGPCLEEVLGYAGVVLKLQIKEGRDKGCYVCRMKVAIHRAGLMELEPR
jgi:hypothetical protein